MTTNKTNRTIKFALAMIIAICLSILCQLPMALTRVYAAEVASSNVSITNSDFDSSTTTVLQSTPSGWSQVGSSTGKAGIIDVSEKTFSNSSRTNSYALASTDQPSTAYTDFDTHILMINAKSTVESTESNHMGYQSNQISLDAYSFYRISVFTLTQENAVASLYLTGFDEEVENTYFERYSSAVWTEYRFYIATGIKEEKINLELWLGSKAKDSMNAVFFDHITMNKISGSYFYDEASKLLDDLQTETDPTLLQQINAQLARRNIIDLRDYEEDVIENADFETGDKSGWTVVNYLPTNSAASVVSINNRASMESLGLEYLKSDLSENNKYSLALYTTSTDKVAVGYQSTEFTVKPYEAYKITVWAKVSSNIDGYAYIKLQEQDTVKNFYGEDDDFYTPTQNSVTISVNKTNELTNNYNEYRFYVKGHELYETNFRLQLWLGEEGKEASGCVVFDNISFEKVSWEQFSNAETTNTTTVELTSVGTEYSVNNGAFNFAEGLGKEVSYPVNPKDWKNTTAEESKTIFGLVNTYSPIYDANKMNFGGLRNPGNPSNAGDVNSDANNVLMLYNSQDSYQTVTSPSLSISKQTYQRITFDYKTVLQTTNTELMYVYILDDDNNILFVDEGLYSSDWSKYTLLVKSTEYSSTIKLVIGLGSQDNAVTGYLFVDNVMFEADDTMTDEMYQEYVKSNKTLDFTVTNFNFISKTQKYGIYSPYKYTQKLEAGTPATSGNDIAYGGIIDGSDNIYGISNSENNNEALKYMPAFIVNNIATYTLTSKDALTLSTDTFYKFSVEVYTRFIGDTEQADVEEDEKLKFGAIFALNGIEKSLTEIVSNDEWTTYTIYVEVAESTDVNLKFGIMNESINIQGQAFFDNFKFETVEENDYKKAVALAETDETILAITVDETEAEDDETPDEEEKDSALIWYLIPSLILFVALIIAIVAYYMKKVTIKKWERKKASEYDRNATLHRDVIRRDAEQIRDEKIKEIENKIAELKAEIERIEKLHQDNVKAQRQTTGGEISRSVERDFKAYAKRHTSLENQIEALNEKIETLKMPEYLLAVQRNLMLEKIKKEKEEKAKEKQAKKEQKKLDNTNK